MQRRRFLGAALTGGVMVSMPASGWPRDAPAASPPLVAPDAFASRSPDDAVKMLFGDRPVAAAAGGLRLEAPLQADGSRIDVSVVFGDHATERIAILVPDHRSPLCAVLTPAAAGVVAFRVRIRLARSMGSTTVLAYADRTYALQRAAATVKLTSGGYGLRDPGPDSGPADGYQTRTTVKARTIGSVTRVIALVDRLGPSPTSRPESLRRRLVFAIGGTPVAQAELGPCTALDCFTGITMHGRLVGERVTLGWTDSRGDRGSADAVVT